MLTEDVIIFLARIPPFQFLDLGELRRVAGEVSMEFYPLDMTILKQNGPPSDSLRVIKQGAVKVIMEGEGGEEIVTEYKGEGDNFGFLSMIGKERQRNTVKAVEDTLCYIIPKDRVQRLLLSSPPFSEYFMAYLSRYVDRTSREIRRLSPLHGTSDRLLFTTRVGDIAIPLATVPGATSIQEAAQVMTQHKISSLVILNENNLPAAIVTDRDLREKVVAKGRKISDPVRNISTLSLIRADGRDTCFEALMKMIQYNIHHLLVVEEGALKGIVTNHDLMLLQGTSPVSFAKDILLQESVEGLAPLVRKTFTLIGLLLKEDTQFFPLSSIMTEIHDRLLRKVLEIGERKLGPPPLPYCWVVLGSEGRREQIFKTDQDNALIYSDPGTPGEEIEAAGYFSVLSNWVRDSLMTMGVPACPQGYMASNPRWCQPFRTWRDLFGNWIVRHDVENTSVAAKFFDSRPLFGKFMLFQGIRNQITPWILEDGRQFLRDLVRSAVRIPPPVGFVRNQVVEKDGTELRRLNVKERGILPLVDLVRVFSLSCGLPETSTLGRIRGLKGKDPTFLKMEGEITHAFEFLMLLNVHHQYEQIRTGIPPDSLLDPAQLSNLDKKTLREAFLLIARLQNLAGTVFDVELP
jgi:CBS domain-containing protein